MMVHQRKPRSRIALAALLPIIVAIFACSSNRNGERTGANVNAITEFELRAGDYSSVYDAVSRLRPGWMRDLGGAFLRNQQLQMGELYRMPLEHIGRIERLTAEEATRRWGITSLSGHYLLIIPR